MFSILTDGILEFIRQLSCFVKVLPFQQGSSPGKTGAKAGKQQSIAF